MVMGNHWRSFTFTMQQTGTWVVTHSKADSNLHGQVVALREHCVGTTCALRVVPTE